MEEHRKCWSGIKSKDCGSWGKISFITPSRNLCEKQSSEKNTLLEE